MKNRKILATSLALVLAGSTLLGGCGIDADATLVDINDGEATISLGYGNFVARYTQSMYDMTYLNYMGTSMWTEEGDDGTTTEDSVKEGILTDIEETYLLVAHAEDYDVSLSDEDKTAISEAAAEFIEENDAETIDEISATQEIVEQYLTNETISRRVEEAIKESADVTVTEEEAAQRTITYAYFNSVTYTDSDGNTGYYTDDEKEALLATAETLVNSSDLETDGEAAGATVTSASYGEDDDTLDEAVIAAADELSEGEISGVVTVENDGYYVIRLDSAHDEDATADKMEELETEKREAYLTEVLDGWKEEISWEVDESAWAEVKFDTFFEAAESDEDTTEE